jgi:DNA-binding transcriptional LysR family regulator
VLDALYPMPRIFDALRAFTEQFPTVPPRLYVASLGAAANLVTNGSCAIGLLPSNIAELAALKFAPITTFRLCSVVSPSHPLASKQGIIEPHVLHQHVQLVLTDASTLTAGKDWGVLSSRTWRLADLGAKKSMLLAGLGWGNMPAHLVEDEIKDGRLAVIQPAGFDSVTALVLGAAYISEHSLGPAGHWMLNHLTRR